MYLRPPQDDKKYSWTRHSIEKMRQYNLSAQRIRRVIRNPKRVEKGVVKDAIAVMQPQGKGRGGKKWSSEIWTMYIYEKENPQRKRIITCWRYPGISPIREVIPIPEDILEEIQEYFNH
jgi:hypothetical protein